MIDRDMVNDRSALLADLPLLGRLPKSHLGQIAAYTRLQVAQAGEVLFRRGDPGHSMMMIVSGRIKIGVESPDGREAALAVLGGGEILGEMALLDGQPRSADATALEHTSLLVLDRRELLPFLERNPVVCMNLLEIMCERLRRTSLVLENHVLLRLPARLAKMLLDLAGPGGTLPAPGVRVNFGMAQKTLAALLGTSRESINKQFRHWQKDGLIRLGRGYVVILQPDVLAEFVRIA